MSVHKATPLKLGPVTLDTLVCQHCGEPIKRVPGGQGPTWVHTNTGAVAGPGAP